MAPDLIFYGTSTSFFMIHLPYFLCLHVQASDRHRDDGFTLALDELFDRLVIQAVFAADDDIIFGGPVFIDLDLALGDLGIPLFDLLVQDIIEIALAVDQEDQMVATVRVGIEGKTGQQMLMTPQDDQNTDCGDIHSGTDGKAKSGCQPDTGRCSQALDAAAYLEDDAGAQKGDAADRLGGNS